MSTILVPAGEAAVGAPIALVAETEAEIETAQQQANSGGAAQSRRETPHLRADGGYLSYSRKAWLSWYRGG